MTQLEEQQKITEELVVKYNKEVDAFIKLASGLTVWNSINLTLLNNYMQLLNKDLPKAIRQLKECVKEVHDSYTFENEIHVLSLEEK